MVDGDTTRSLKIERGKRYLAGLLQAIKQDQAESGKYAIEFEGSGDAILHIFKFDGNGGGSFVALDRWRAFTRSSTTQVIQCRVWPHYSSDGRPIIQVQTDTNGSAPASGSFLQSYHALPHSTVNRIVYIPQFVGSASTRPGTSEPRSFISPVTGPGPVRIDARRDVRIAAQVSVLKHLNTATHA